MDRQSWDGNRHADAEPFVSQGSEVLPSCASGQIVPEIKTSMQALKDSSSASCESGNCPEMGEASHDLTVVTVCLNAMGVLPRCVRSVQPLLRTSALRVEYLVIDGGSSDGTPEYLEKEVQRGSVSRFVSEPDGGLYEAMNRGLCLARGKVVVFIHADDEICPEAALDCCAPILSGTAGYVMSSALVLTPEGKKHSLSRPDARRSVAIASPCCHQSMYCSVDLLRRLGGFDVRWRIVADAELYVRLVKAGIPFAIVEKVSARFRLGGQSSLPLIYEEWLRLMQKYEDDIAERCSRDEVFLDDSVRQLLRIATHRPNTWETLSAFMRRLWARLEPEARARLRRRLIPKTMKHDVMRILMPFSRRIRNRALAYHLLKKAFV